MHRQSWNENWTWKHLDTNEPPNPVSLPHDAMLSEPRSEIAPSGTNGCWIEGRDYLYEKVFTMTASEAAQKLALEFEGVYHNAEVWLNGEKLTFRPYGYTNFYVDLTDKVKPGEENHLKVIARNADQPNCRWYSGAGIYRPVWLWTADREAYIPLNSLRVRTRSIAPPEIEVTLQTSKPGDVMVDILDGTNVLWSDAVTTDGSVTLPILLPDARLWNVDTPHLYTCRVRFGTDEETVLFGIRTLDWGTNGLLLNGQRVILRGACIHHDNGILGACCYPEAEERKVRLLKENGYNALRSAHNPCSKALLDACDRLGFLVMDEYIDHWYIHKTQHDYVNYFPDWWQQDLSDMVDKDFNHPSVILYSTGNEVSETAQPKGIALTQELTDYLHALDATRPVTCGVNIFFNFLSSIGFGVYSDDKAKKEAEQAEKARQSGKSAKKKAVGSQFFNNLAGLFGSGFMKLGATLPFCDWKTRDAFAAMDMAGYNYGIKRYKGDLKKYPDRLILGSETFCSDACQFWELAKREPRLIGDFVWAGMDYLGETMVGSWEYKDYAPRFDGGKGWMTAGSGRIDLTGKPLCEALYTRVALEQASGPYLGIRPVNHTGDKHSPSAWKFSNAQESWTWPGCEGEKAEIEIYARAYSVELLVNGVSVGKKRLQNTCLAKFTCPYAPGKLEAISYDETGAKIGCAVLKTAGATTVLQAEPEQESVKPGGLLYVRLRYTDEHGILKPLERGDIQVTVSGGTLLALGNGCPFHDRSYLSDTTDTYWGEALAVIQAEGSGPVRLRAESACGEREIMIPCVGKETLQ